MTAAIIISFVIGGMVGCTLGVLVAGLCNAASKNADDDYHELDY